MHRIPLRVGAIVLALALIVAGSLVGLARSRNDGAASAAPASSAATPYGDCRVYRDGSDLSVRILGAGAGSLCADWIRGRSSSSEFWTADGTPPANEAYWQTCQLIGDDGVALTVYDSGGRIGGRAICGELVNGGWAEV
jgi:hypothetical protein